MCSLSLQLTRTYLCLSSDTSGCGGNLTDIPAGSLTSPGFPGNSTVLSTICTWRITPPIGRQMNLKIVISEGEDSCASNYLEIRSGTLMTSPPIGTFCSSDIVSNYLVLSTLYGHSTVTF